MSKTLLSAAILTTALSACTDSWAKDTALLSCELLIKSKIKSPRSYERVKFEIIPLLGSITITYDAANTYNAMIRETYTCNFSYNETDQGFVLEEDPASNEAKCQKYWNDNVKRKITDPTEGSMQKDKYCRLRREANTINEFRQSFEKSSYPVSPFETQLRQ